MPATSADDYIQRYRACVPLRRHWIRVNSRVTMDPESGWGSRTVVSLTSLGPMPDRCDRRYTCSERVTKEYCEPCFRYWDWIDDVLRAARRATGLNLAYSYAGPGRQFCTEPSVRIRHGAAEVLWSGGLDI